jgi:hypothetical protein
LGVLGSLVAIKGARRAFFKWYSHKNQQTKHYGEINSKIYCLLSQISFEIHLPMMHLCARKKTGQEKKKLD